MAASVNYMETTEALPLRSRRLRRRPVTFSWVAQLGRVIGKRLRPRVLVWGLVDDDEVDALRAIFATVHQPTSWGLVDPLEWDALICVGDLPPVHEHAHLCIVAIGASHLGQAEMSHAGDTWMNRTSAEVSAELLIPPSVHSVLAKLVDESLTPNEMKRQPHAVIREWQWDDAAGTFTARPEPSQAVVPLLTTNSGTPIAGSFVRGGGAATLWAFPGYANIVTWSRVALADWQSRWPERFPPNETEPWDHRRPWLTAQEIAVLDERATLRERREEAVRKLDALDAEVDARLLGVTESAGRLQRAILTAQGDDLVAAVVDCLVALGFHCQNMDEVWPDGQRREDLRVTLDTLPDWEAVVEVRGYTRGAQLADLLRLQGRFAVMYEREEGRPPSACWYIVNQLVGRDPSERDAVLASNPDEFAVFVEDHDGAAMDTTALFRLRRAVDLGEMAREAAADLLVNLKGRLDLTA